MTAPNPRLEVCQAPASGPNQGRLLRPVRHEGKQVTAPTSRMDVITERLESAKHHGAPAFMIPTADVAYLLAELRKAQDKLARVEDLAKYLDRLAPGDQHYAGLIRAAVSDATGGGQ